MNSFNRLCVLDTPYSLLVYLVYSSEDDIKNTFFVFGKNMSKGLEKYINVYYITETQSLLNKRTFRWLYYRYIKYFKLPIINKGTTLFCHDHLPFSSVIISNNNYTMIEDSPDICSNYINGKMHERILKSRKSIKNKLYNFLYGNLYDKVFAENAQCDSILMTKKDCAKYISNKKHIVFSLQEYWDKSSSEKKELILRIFNVNDTDISIMRKYKTILFTQPLTDIISENRQKKVFSYILSHYSPNEILIKVHPRDKINYKELFPKYSVFKKQIPSQIIDLLDIKFDRVVTCFSTAVTMFNYPIKIDWYGTEIDDELFKKVGHIAPPQKKS